MSLSVFTLRDSDLDHVLMVASWCGASSTLVDYHWNWRADFLRLEVLALEDGLGGSSSAIFVSY